MNTQKIVTVTNQGVQFWLRGPTFAFRLARAQRFDSATAALAGIERARKFHHATLIARCEIQDDPTADGVQS